MGLRLAIMKYPHHRRSLSNCRCSIMTPSDCRHQSQSPVYICMYACMQVLNALLCIAVSTIYCHGASTRSVPCDFTLYSHQLCLTWFQSGASIPPTTMALSPILTCSPLFSATPTNNFWTLYTQFSMFSVILEAVSQG